MKTPDLRMIVYARLYRQPGVREVMLLCGALLCSRREQRCGQMGKLALQPGCSAPLLPSVSDSTAVRKGRRGEGEGDREGAGRGHQVCLCLRRRPVTVYGRSKTASTEGAEPEPNSHRAVHFLR